MRRRLIIGIAAALALGVAPAVIVAAPALASVHVCTAHGNKYCLGASSLTDGTAVTNSSPGRDIILQYQGFTSKTFAVYQLVFADDTSKCVGFSSAGKAEVRDCSGNSNYTNWGNDILGDGSTAWVNNSYTQCSRGGDQGPFLTSNNAQGVQLYCSNDFISGDYVAFTPTLSP